MKHPVNISGHTLATSCLLCLYCRYSMKIDGVLMCCLSCFSCCRSLCG
ncbi:unnamed protein product [Chondrus crispus]|uniref:Uncharacterized protein n=1 Tax=Chondrus crispus TaxID=2769 RepID=R7Q385_CHOCR|nr:unnamed protein product [Chondrus crispus]CDF32992.1 unnamed protein product [Chondrus crispus]|eukprot:XP_005712795.1 unnamed protein product [Chondrus crispus]